MFYDFFYCSCPLLKILDNMDMIFQAIISPPCQFDLWGSAQLGLLKGMTARQLAMLPNAHVAKSCFWTFPGLASRPSGSTAQPPWHAEPHLSLCHQPGRNRPRWSYSQSLFFNVSPGKPCSFPDSTNRTGCHLYGTLTPACYTRFPLPYKPDFFITGTLTTVQSTILTETLTSGVTAGLAVASRLSDLLSSKTKDDRRWLNLRRLQHQRGGALLDKKSFGKHQYMIWGLGRYITMM